MAKREIGAKNKRNRVEQAGIKRAEAIEWKRGNGVPQKNVDKRGIEPVRLVYSHYLAEEDHPAVQMVHAIAEPLRGMGHEVAIHRCAGPPPQEGQQNIQAPRARGKRGLAGRLKDKVWFLKAMARNFGMLPRDRQALRDFAPNLVLARQDAYCWSMVKACIQQKIPVITYADAPVAYETRLFDSSERWHPPGLVERLECWGLKRSLAAITVSNPAARRLRLYGLNTPIHVVPNGVDPTRFPIFSPEERAHRRRALGLTAPIIAGFQGTFRAFHGIHRLRELILATADQRDVHWLLIGDGPERHPLEDAVTGKAPVTFLGRQPSSRMGELLALLDIAVAPHTPIQGDFYFCPLKILEYAAAGCAVLAGDQGDIRHLLDEGRAGVVLSNQDLTQWKQEFLDLVADTPRRQNLGIQARQHVLNQLTWENTAKAVARVLESAR